jgi:hypothetical protein
MRLLVIGGLLAMIPGACSTLEEETPRDAAVWTASDTANWSRIAHESLGGPGEQQMTAVTTFAGKLVAVGFEIVDGDRDGRAWVSEDGREWVKVTDPDLGGPGEQSVWAVTEAGPGLVAAGSTGSSQDVDAAFWVSADGLDWIQVPSIASFQGRGIQSVATVEVHDDQIYAGGADYTDAALWTSPDGMSWSPVADPDFAGDGEQKLWRLQTTRHGLIAVGEDNRDAAVWILDDTWTKIEDPVFGGDGHQLIRDVVEWDDMLVAVGGAFTYEEIYFLGQGLGGNLDALVWTSRDGLVWNRVEDEDVPSGIGDQVMQAVVVWDDRLLGAGYDLAGRGNIEEGLAPFGSGLDVDAAVWSSDNATMWTRANSQALGGDDWQDIWGVAVVPELGIVAVGGDDLGTDLEDSKSEGTGDSP